MISFYYMLYKGILDGAVELDSLIYILADANLRSIEATD